MRLADFIVANLEPILLEWEAFARGITSGEKMNAPALCDYADEILLATVRDMQSAQSVAERTATSRGHRRNDIATFFTARPSNTPSVDWGQVSTYWSWSRNTAHSVPVC